MTDNVPHFQSQEPGQRTSQREIKRNASRISGESKRRGRRQLPGCSISSEISEALQNFGVLASPIYDQRREISLERGSDDTKLISTKPFLDRKAVVLKPPPDIS
jgi:hypothetical protein